MPRGSEIESTAVEPVKAPTPAAPKAAAPKKAAAPRTAAPAAAATKKAATPAAPAAPAATTPAAAPEYLLPKVGEAWMRKQETEAALQPYLQAIGRVAELRREGQIGEITREAPAYVRSSEEDAALLPKLSYPAMQSMTIPGGSKPSRLGGTAPAQARVVAPTRTPTPADLTKTRNELVSEAKQTGEKFTSAIAAYNAADKETSRKIRGGEARAEDMPALAAEQRRQLQEVLNLAAQMREYGFTGTNDDLIRQFEPK